MLLLLYFLKHSLSYLTVFSCHQATNIQTLSGHNLHIPLCFIAADANTHLVYYSYMHSNFSSAEAFHQNSISVCFTQHTELYSYFRRYQSSTRILEKRKHSTYSVYNSCTSIQVVFVAVHCNHTLCIVILVFIFIFILNVTQ